MDTKLSMYMKRVAMMKTFEALVDHNCLNDQSDKIVSRETIDVNTMLHDALTNTFGDIMEYDDIIKGVLNPDYEPQNKFVSRETVDDYFVGKDGVINHVWYANDTNRVVLESTKPCCHYYEPFEGVCLIECTWCDNPYHCRLNNVSRETYANIDDLMIIVDGIERMCNNHQYESCTWCRDEIACDMTIIAISMLLRGEY